MGKNLAIVGNSVGGNMTAAAVLMAKEKKGPEIKLQVLLWPVTDANFETEYLQRIRRRKISYQEYDDLVLG